MIKKFINNDSLTRTVGITGSFALLACVLGTGALAWYALAEMEGISIQDRIVVSLVTSGLIAVPLLVFLLFFHKILIKQIEYDTENDKVYIVNVLGKSRSIQARTGKIIKKFRHSLGKKSYGYLIGIKRYGFLILSKNAYAKVDELTKIIIKQEELNSSKFSGF